MKKELKTKYYKFWQNNSGGYFVNNDDVREYVIIEALDENHANSIAEDIGIYFDGVAYGMDCECCGDRWYRVNEYDIIKDDLNLNDYSDVVFYPLQGEKVIHKQGENEG